MPSTNKRARRRTRRDQKTAKPVRSRRHGRLRIPAGEFKAVCLRVMERVKQTGEEVVITKRGQPVAKLGPVTDADLRPFVGRSRGVITASRANLLAPLGDWEVDADL